MTELARILYFQDDPCQHGFVKEKLESKGFDVVVAVDWRSCLEKISQVSIELLVLDISETMSNAFPVLEQCVKQHINIPSVLVLNSYEQTCIRRAVELGCAAFVCKNNDYIDVLSLNIHNVIEKERLIKLNAALEKDLIKTREIADRVQSIAKIGNWEYYPGTEKANWSEQEYRIFGYQPGAVVPTYQSYINVIHPDDRDVVEQFNMKCFEDHAATDFVFRLKLADNQVRYIRAITEVDLDGDDKVIRIFGVSQDVTEQKNAEAQLRQNATVFEITTQAIYVTNENDTIVSVNPAFTTLTGYSEEQVLGKKTSFLCAGQHDAQFFYDFWASLKQQGVWQGEINYQHRDGHVFPTWQSISAVKDAQGNIVQYVSVFSDISKRKANEALIRYQANFDPLTDLPNRTLFQDRMDLAIKQANRSGAMVGLMLMDLDRFKWINDTMGHKAGDLVLQEVARRMQGTVRNSDTVARLGGDEFIVLLPELKNDKDAELVAEKIFASFSKPVEIDGNEVFISGSIGISLYPNDGKDVEALQKNADSAMYSAKDAGRNRYHYFTPLLQQEAEKRLKLISNLRRAIEREEFSVFYQPIIDLKEKLVCRAEALIRWKHPKLGYISPIDFIPLAEETGLIRSIGDWVVYQVARDMGDWNGSGLDSMEISINMSPKQLSSSMCNENFKKVFAEYGVALSRLSIEITESVFMGKGSDYLETLGGMQAGGVKISLDDFGTGYSSLSYLKRFHVDILKIDREFINDLNTDPSDAMLVESILSLAEKMQIKVIAEGVENKEQLQFLQKNNCRYVQGFYFSKPLPRQDFENYLNTFAWV